MHKAIIPTAVSPKGNRVVALSPSLVARSKDLFTASDEVLSTARHIHGQLFGGSQPGRSDDEFKQPVSLEGWLGAIDLNTKTANGLLQEIAERIAAV